MTTESPWEELEHPADIRLRVRGEDLGDLLENAGEGMIEVFLDVKTIENRGSMRIQAQGEDPESVLVNWLQEILFAFDAERFAPCRVELLSLDEGRAEGRLEGEQFAPGRHVTRSEIKAVTYHGLEVRETDGGLEATVLFDV